MSLYSSTVIWKVNGKRKVVEAIAQRRVHSLFACTPIYAWTKAFKSAAFTFKCISCAQSHRNSFALLALYHAFAFIIRCAISLVMYVPPRRPGVPHLLLPAGWLLMSITTQWNGWDNSRTKSKLQIMHLEHLCSQGTEASQFHCMVWIFQDTKLWD